MQDILRRVHDSDDGGAAMAEALGVVPPADAAGPSSGADEAGSVHEIGGGGGSDDEGDDVSPEEPLSEATLRRVLASAQASGGGGGADFKVALEQLDPRELREFNRFVTSGQVRYETYCAESWMEMDDAKYTKMCFWCQSCLLAACSVTLLTGQSGPWCLSAHCHFRPLLSAGGTANRTVAAVVVFARGGPAAAHSARHIAGETTRGCRHTRCTLAA